MKRFLFILIFLISSCGYQPIYLNNNLKNFEFNKIIAEGEKEINRNIINSLSLKENRNDKQLNELLIKSSFRVEETSKNKKGQEKSYRSSILVNLTVNKNKNIIKSKSFSEEFVYNKY